MTTYTIDPIKNKLVADKESKDVKMMKNLKKEKPFQNILENSRKFNINHLILSCSSVDSRWLTINKVTSSVDNTS